MTEGGTGRLQTVNKVVQQAGEVSQVIKGFACKGQDKDLEAELTQREGAQRSRKQSGSSTKGTTKAFISNGNSAFSPPLHQKISPLLQTTLDPTDRGAWRATQSIQLQTSQT